MNEFQYNDEIIWYKCTRILQIKLTLVLTKPPRQFLMPPERWCDQSFCIREKASCICSGLSGVLASKGGKNNDDAGGVQSASRSGDPSRRRLFTLLSILPTAFRFPSVGDEWSWCDDSSRDFFTSRPPSVRARTISNAKNPTMSIVSSAALRSIWFGKLRNSRKRLAARSS